MKNIKLLCVIPLALAFTLSSCSAGETPRLDPSAQSPSSSSTLSATPDKSSTPETTPGTPSSGTPSTGEPAGPSPAPSAQFTPPYVTSDEPIILPEPKYDHQTSNPATEENLNDPAVSSEVFSIYVAYNEALKNKDWEKACTLIDLSPEKGMAYCVEEYGKQAWTVNDNVKSEDYLFLKESISKNIIMQKKTNETQYMDRALFVLSDGTYKLHSPFMAPSIKF